MQTTGGESSKCFVDPKSSFPNKEIKTNPKTHTVRYDPNLAKKSHPSNKRDAITIIPNDSVTT